MTHAEIVSRLSYLRCSELHHHLQVIQQTAQPMVDDTAPVIIKQGKILVDMIVI